MDAGWVLVMLGGMVAIVAIVAIVYSRNFSGRVDDHGLKIDVTAPKETPGDHS